jgi:hypothetical protein
MAPDQRFSDAGVNEPEMIGSSITALKQLRFSFRCAWQGDVPRRPQ